MFSKKAILRMTRIAFFFFQFKMLLVPKGNLGTGKKHREGAIFLVTVHLETASLQLSS
jgi:hypothetical protein